MTPSEFENWVFWLTVALVLVALGCCLWVIRRARRCARPTDSSRTTDPDRGLQSAGDLGVVPPDLPEYGAGLGAATVAKLPPRDPTALSRAYGTHHSHHPSTASTLTYYSATGEPVELTSPQNYNETEEEEPVEWIHPSVEVGVPGVEVYGVATGDGAAGTGGEAWV